MRTSVIIENLKCDDCKNSVVAALKKIKGITNYNIDITTGSLSLNYSSLNAIEGLRFYLLKIEHPITEDVSLIKSRNSEMLYFQQEKAFNTKHELVIKYLYI